MNKGKILVVDDEENIRGSLKGILGDEGYEVCLAQDGESALRMIRAQSPDLVLLDIWIPGIDGIQTLEILKNIDTRTEVVMMSGHGAIDTAVKATKLGALDFIEKPFSIDLVLRVVNEALVHRKKQDGTDSVPGLETPAKSWFAGKSDHAKKIRAFIRAASRSGKPVLVNGQRGLGKKLAARLIHKKSSRGQMEFKVISLKGIIDDKEKTASANAQTGKRNGTIKEKPDWLECLGTEGTVFFNKIEKFPARLQRHLLKAISDGNFRMQGKAEPAPVKARVIVSWETPDNGRNGRLAKGFADFFNTATLEIHNLAERKIDIPELARKFMDDFSAKYGKKVNSIDPGLLEFLTSYPFAGNTRELYSIMELAVLACDGSTLTNEHIFVGNQGRGTRPKGSTQKTASGRAGPGSTGTSTRASRARNGRKKNLTPQRTLQRPMVVCGQGLHSGIKTGLSLSPAPPGSGIVFCDISSGERVPALMENVRSTEYATTLSNGEVVIKTIEHIMSALHSYQITNLLVKIGDEAPIMDGSAIEFCQTLENGGIEEQDAFTEWIVIDKPISVGDPEQGPYLAVEPADEFSIHYHLDYPAPIGKQEHTYVYESGEHYKKTIAPARTFGFLKDYRKMEDAGLAGGGKLSNVVLVDNEKIINTPLRFPNEPARHKILDLIGDLYLLGRPIKGRFIAKKSGHTQNVALVDKINKLANGHRRGNTAV